LSKREAQQCDGGKCTPIRRRNKRYLVNLSMRVPHNFELKNDFYDEVQHCDVAKYRQARSRSTYI
jgi:hypothetical protein